MGEVEMSQKTRFPDTPEFHTDNLIAAIAFPLDFGMPDAWPSFRMCELAIEDPLVPTVEEQENDVLGVQ